MYIPALHILESWEEIIHSNPSPCILPCVLLTTRRPPDSRRQDADALVGASCCIRLVCYREWEVVANAQIRDRVRESPGGRIRGKHRKLPPEEGVNAKRFAPSMINPAVRDDRQAGERRSR